MSKEIITERQGIAMMVLFIVGSTLVIGTSDIPKQDNWLSVILAMFMALPILMLYARLIHLFPGKDLFTIIQQILGKVAGKIISFIFVWYAFHLGALVIRNFSEFLSEATMWETPQYSIQLALVLLCIWAVKSGIEVLGRWTSFVLNIFLIGISMIFLMSLYKFNFAHFTPMLNHDLGPVIKGAYSIFHLPLAQTVIFTAILSFLKPNASSYKVYFLSLLIGGGILFIIVFMNIGVLGFPFLSTQYFPTYITVSLIDYGEFFRRFEALIAVAFLLCGFVKVSICLFCAATGIAKIFNINDYRILTAPLSLLMVTLATIIYSSMQEMFEWVEVGAYYAIPFQILLPLIIWISAEAKVRLQKPGVV